MKFAIAGELWRLARFSIVGLLATGMHIGVAMLAVKLLSISPTIASMVGFIAAFVLSYIGHFRFTFAVAGRYRDYVVKFAVSSLASFILSTGCVWVATTLLGIDYKIALTALAVIVPLCNYVLNRFWVFLQPEGLQRRSLETI